MVYWKDDTKTVAEKCRDGGTSVQLRMPSDVVRSEAAHSRQTTDMSFRQVSTTTEAASGLALNPPVYHSHLSVSAAQLWVSGAQFGKRCPGPLTLAADRQLGCKRGALRSQLPLSSQLHVLS
jgi:hypothetical protein